jgi:hypothetical protein
MPEHNNELTYHLLGVPLRTGSLYPGSENDAQAYRDAHLLRCLEAAGCRVFDEGDVAIQKLAWTAYCLGLYQRVYRPLFTAAGAYPSAHRC